MPIEKSIVSRDDRLYEAFPSIAATPSGRLVCIYRESDAHRPVAISNLVWRTSDDSGRTWGPRRLLAQAEPRGDRLFAWNCPRIVCLQDGRLIYLCDAYELPPDEDQGCRDSRIYFWVSKDQGQTFEGPQCQSGPIGVVPDRILVTHQGTWLFSTTYRPATGKMEGQYLWRSTDEGKTWEEPVCVAYDDDLVLCEGSTVQLDSGALVCYLREDQCKGRPVFKAISHDDGLSWEGVYPTLMPCGHRPVAGLTTGGKVMVTFAEMLNAVSPGRRNLRALLETQVSALDPDRDKQSGIVIPLDHDRGLIRLTGNGYTGWVQLPGDDFLVVNYIFDDAPNGHIRSYRFSESDFAFDTRFDPLHYPGW